jgi:hypothetical protein
VQYSTASYYFILLGSKYSPQHPVIIALNLCPSLNVTDQVSHPHKTTGKCIVLYLLIFTFLDSGQEEQNGRKHLRNSKQLFTN